jgi:serine phosphatase RsbU (regulator of sigma subunit)
MSIVGHNILDSVVREQHITQPSRVLDELNKGISYTLRQTDLEDNTVRDGMDIALCSFNAKTAVLQYAGAFNPMWLIRDGELIEYKGNKFPIGNTRPGEEKKFTNHEVQLQKGDTIYVFSDGYCDQFGGPDGKKFKASSLRQLLLKSQHLNMEEQLALLSSTIENWRGNHEQVDDILVIGTRYE